MAQKQVRKISAGKVALVDALKMPVVPREKIKFKVANSPELQAPLSAIPSCAIVEPVPDEAAIARLLSDLDPAAQSLVNKILQGLAEHLGSKEAARIWLVVESPEFGMTPLKAIRSGKAQIVQSVLEGHWGPNPSYAYAPALPAALAGIHHLAVPLAELTFRASHLRYFNNLANAQPLFCAIGSRDGTRFVAPAGPRAIYAAFDADTAYEEFNQAFFGVARTSLGGTLAAAGLLRPDPCVTLGIHVRLSRLLSLAFPYPQWYATRVALGINTLSDAEMCQPWAGIPSAPTQVLGTAVFHDGFFEGIIYPSARKAGQNCVVVFRDRLLQTSQIHFTDTAIHLTAQLP